MKIFYKIIQIAITLALIGGMIFYFKDDIKLAEKNLTDIINPCDKPLEYSLGELDPKFDLSRADFLKIINQAAEIWQEPVNKKLFNYVADGDLKINLVYDSRQASTDKLSALGISINNDKASYDALKNKHNLFNKKYKQQKNQLDDIIEYYEEQKANYEDEVKAANNRGGASPEEYAILEQERLELNRQVELIKINQAALNKTTDDINAVVKVINKLIRELNLTVGDYNTVGAVASGEFQEGQYIRDRAGERIDIFQFDDQAALLRVLAHELGHALGLEHLENPKSIMYYLNESGNEKITSDDIKELKRACKIK